MSITSFGKGRDDFETQTKVATSTRSSSATAGGLTAFIDQGSEFEGKLSFKDTVRIDGRFRGEITSENTLIVGESGEIEANIRSNTIAISGAVQGDVTAGVKLVLHKTARLDGNIETPSIVVEEGASLNGSIKMTGPKSGAASLKAVGNDKSSGKNGSDSSGN